MKMLTRQGHLVEEEGVSYIADMDADYPLASLQAASCTYRIALGPRAGQKVLRLRTVPGRDAKTTAALCANAHGFSLHAGVRCGAHQREGTRMPVPLHHPPRVSPTNDRNVEA
jgi:hypothetical protein